jgi:antitoxin HigA-1
MTLTSKITTRALGPMKAPSHPGDVIWYGILEPLGVSVTKAASMLGIRRATLSDVINGKSALTSEMAFRLQKAFGADAAMLMRVQINYELAQHQKHAKDFKVKRYHPKAA